MTGSAGVGIIVMLVSVVLGFVAMLLAASGYRAGWSRVVVWVSFGVAVLLLTVIPLVLALTVGLDPQ